MKKMMTILALIALCQGAALADTRYYPRNYLSNTSYYSPRNTRRETDLSITELIELHKSRTPEVRSFTLYDMNNGGRLRDCTDDGISVTCF